MTEYTIKMPLRVEVGKKTKKLQTINLNYYRNWHRYTESSVKKAYHKLAIEALRLANVPYMSMCRLEFQLHKRTRQQKDKANFLSIHEKYFCDAMVEAGILTDDTDDYIIEQHYHQSLINPDDPCVVIKIIPLD